MPTQFKRKNFLYYKILNVEQWRAALVEYGSHLEVENQMWIFVDEFAEPIAIESTFWNVGLNSKIENLTRGFFRFRTYAREFMY